jgi:protein-S-isoprenylcysteine O-methyltransferase Ste14
MDPRIVDGSLLVAAGVPLVRCAWCVVGFVRMFRNHRRARRSEWGWLQLAMAPEGYVQATAALLLAAGLATSADSAPGAAWAICGAALSVAGLALSIWTFWSFPSIGTGHYVAEGQLVIRHGPYRWVRHPTYVAVLAIWFGLGVAYRDLPVLALAVLYSALYGLYARSEERLMLSAFGEDYAGYQARVNGFFPHWPRLGGAREAPRASR